MRSVAALLLIAAVIFTAQYRLLPSDAKVETAGAYRLVSVVDPRTIDMEQMLEYEIKRSYCVLSAKYIGLEEGDDGYMQSRFSVNRFLKGGEYAEEFFNLRYTPPDINYTPDKYEEGKNYVLLCLRSHHVFGGDKNFSVSFLLEHDEKGNFTKTKISEYDIEFPYDTVNELARYIAEIVPADEFGELTTDDHYVRSNKLENIVHGCEVVVRARVERIYDEKMKVEKAYLTPLEVLKGKVITTSMYKNTFHVSTFGGSMEEGKEYLFLLCKADRVNYAFRIAAAEGAIIAMEDSNKVFEVRNALMQTER